MHDYLDKSPQDGYGTEDAATEAARAAKARHQARNLDVFSDAGRWHWVVW